MSTNSPMTPCGCGAGATASRPDRTAVQVDPEIKTANLKHLRRIEGQVRGLTRMVEEDRYCADIITQVAAARESLLAVARNLMRNHVKHCAVASLEHKGRKRDEMIDELVDLVGKVTG